ncbi:MAG TPA: hypothetical protein VK882_03160 [Nitrososphaeraceae archaeon]|nr:hypothetical protein [Nitrososphaeraceae archaeon]
MGCVTKITGYFFGIIIVLFSLLWIISAIPLSVIIDGLIGLNIVILGFCILYSVHRAGRQKKHQQELQLDGSINNQ